LTDFSRVKCVAQGISAPHSRNGIPKPVAPPALTPLPASPTMKFAPPHRRGSSEIRIERETDRGKRICTPPDRYEDR